MSLQSLRQDWLRNPVREMLAGAVATFALIPEVIAFSFAAGVDPQVGLFASFVIGIVIAFAGGRPAMISAAAAPSRWWRRRSCTRTGSPICSRPARWPG